MQVSSYARRLAAVGEQARSRGVDAVLVTPGPDLHYLTGYDALPLERLTCLVVPAEGDPVMVVPRLERMAAEAIHQAETDLVAAIDGGLGHEMRQ